MRKRVAQFLYELACIDGLARQVGLCATLIAAGLREPQERELLPPGLLPQLLAQPLDDRFGLVKGRRARPLIRHRKTVVQKHDMMPLAAAKEAAECVLHNW